MGEDGSFWVDGKKAIIGALVAISLNPISVFTGYYLSKKLQSPRFSVEYVKITPNKGTLSVPDSLFSEINYYRRQNLVFENEINEKVPYECNESFKSKSYDDKCITNLIGAISSFVGLIENEESQMRSSLIEIEKWKPNEELRLPFARLADSPESIIDMIRKDKSKTMEKIRDLISLEGQSKFKVKQFSSALSKILALPESGKTGDVKMRIGILNLGDLEGAIYPNGEIFVNDIKVFVKYSHEKYESEFPIIGSHSFKSLEFEIDEPKCANDDLSKWKSFVKSASQERIEIKLKSATKFITCSGRMEI